RDHTISVNAILSDGTEAEFGPISKDQFLEKMKEQTLEAQIYRNIHEVLTDPGNREEIIKEYPDPRVHRRNTGYSIDLLLNSEPFTKAGEPFNFAKLIAGSEGTLAFITEIKLNVVSLPPRYTGLVCVHFESLPQAFQGNLIALKHKPAAVELMDQTILRLTEQNIGLRDNRFFISGDPAAILIIEFTGESEEEITLRAEAMEKEMRSAGMGYHFPLISGKDISKVWNLRKAGLGVLSNMPGDAKPVSVIEDTAVHPEVLPDYMDDFSRLLEKYKLECVYHAHIATGELHLRPVLNLKNRDDVELYRIIAEETARLVKKYKGSLSGEHGDGRLRGEFIPLMVGEKNYALLENIKDAWDPHHIFNPGKITATPDMRTKLRYEPGLETRDIVTFFDFSKDQGVLRATEKCNGSGDCRKSEVIGGTMCPSFMATRDENTTTRARANILREFLTNSDKSNPFNHKEIYDVMDLCLSCKGCKSECPSNVDITKYKAEFLQHYYDANGVPLRARLIAEISNINKLGMIMPGIFNFFTGNPFTSTIIKKALGFAPRRSIPPLYKITLRAWMAKNRNKLIVNSERKGKVFLFADEFTQYNDTAIGITTIKLLTELGYEVEIPGHTLSGRTYLSKGLVRKAKKYAEKNVRMLSEKINKENPLIGIEPSGILTFRDEYRELVSPELRVKAEHLSGNCFMIDEFIASEFEKGNITADQFTKAPLNIKLHGHCYQKSLASTKPTHIMLSIPENYKVVEIKSGCCGMAGSFGFEKEHYDLSMKVGELVLFPEVRKTDAETIIAAPGTSCRHQIHDGTGRKAKHPAEILYEALNKRK
ncbi:MAG: 4Fe-4S dicluster domain-containing protein, partial [Bacteroidetes bacterium]|nr:4Fe-4S dicluster domain-containing protein [Bacteroidota bacterium]